MNDRVTRSLLWILTPCAILVTVLVGRQVLSTRAEAPGAGLPRRVADWRSIAAEGRRIGSPTAQVTIVEFGDFECGFCAEFRVLFASLRRDFGDSLALVYRHYPLPFHQHAYGAALAAECAAAQGRFEAMHDTLYAWWNRLADRSMVAFAMAAGVRDTLAFSRCLRSEEVAARIRRDRDYIERLGRTGTPTLIINGDVVMGTPPEAELRRIVSRQLRRAPRGGARSDQ